MRALRLRPGSGLQCPSDRSLRLEHREAPSESANEWHPGLACCGEQSSTTASNLMDRERLWPNFRKAWVLHEDRDIIVVDKPCGVPSQAVDSERPDDLATRLKAHLAEKDPSAYLGIHQRLDKETSGVILFSRR